MAKRKSLLSASRDAIASLTKINRDPVREISTETAMADADEFEQTFKGTSSEMLQEQARSEADAVRGRHKRNRPKVRPERVSYRARTGSIAAVMPSGPDRPLLILAL